MSNIVMESAELMQMLPESEQQFAYEFIKKLVRSWDPDFTKLTPSEREKVDAAEKSGFMNENEIDWEHLEQYA
ncbi:MAG: hypothetical protein IJ617_01785 [Oscillospiraceae bacterium]|nr:hypothetical protein [Oscillospiraceae bacterium]